MEEQVINVHNLQKNEPEDHFFSDCNESLSDVIPEEIETLFDSKTQTRFEIINNQKLETTEHI